MFCGIAIAGGIVQAVLRPTCLDLDVLFFAENPLDLIQRQSVDVLIVDLQQLIARLEGDSPPFEEAVLLDADNPHFAVPFADLNARVLTVFGLGHLTPQGVTGIYDFSLLWHAIIDNDDDDDDENDRVIASWCYSMMKKKTTTSQNKMSLAKEI